MAHAPHHIAPAPTPTPRQERVSGVEIASWIVAGAVLAGALVFELLPALLSGLLMHQLARMLAGRIKIGNIRRAQMRLIAVVLLIVVILGLLTATILGAVAAVHSVTNGLPVLLQQLADMIENIRKSFPAALVAKLPEGADELTTVVTGWLRDHAGMLGHFGMQATRILVNLLVGLVIGAMVALYDVRTATDLGPLGRALEERAYRLGRAFRGVVFGQVRIAAINTVFTAVYLVVALPLLGIHLPLAGALVGLTFVAGLLPVIGNLISNTAILIVSLSVSPAVALASLAFLVVIHKLEYFLNARIIGSQVHAYAWELLIAMLVMEAGFGVYGLVAAPIYYAYLKQELVSEKLI
jgi:predicted PurR-regulated permease PerM